MDGKFFRLLGLEVLLDNLKGYIETKIELIKIEAQEKLTTLITVILVFFCVAVFGVLAFFFLNFALALYLNQLCDSNFLGFVILGSFYLLIMILLILSINKGFIHRIIRRSIQSMFAKPKK